MTSSPNGSSFADAQDYEIAEPKADAMIQSLRAFGYDLPTALADLIDNSISAGSKNIWLEFFWSGAASCIAVLDDGRGMSPEVLVNAMRPGSTSPLEKRDAKDLGRFGLGLKTASFSQCRRLTVGTGAVGSGTAVRCWDLDFVTQTGQWRLLRGGSEQFDQFWKRLDAKPAGTAVVWELMDRVVGDADVQSEENHRRFLDHAEDARRHIGMVFHRFLENPRTLKIFINNQRIEAWDPFLGAETATQQLIEEAHALFGEKIIIRPYVLPHFSKISEEIYQRAEGPRGWNAQQGFYVYRNQRLIAAGDWLNLHGLRKEEHFKLARILLDIPNSMDSAWEIDVKKSRAVPPPHIRGKLLQIAKLTRQTASGIYRHRGTRLTQSAGDVVPLWNRKVRHGQIFYEIEREHPLVKSLSAVSPAVRRTLNSLLSLVEETVPIPMITVDTAESPNKHAKPFEGRNEDEVRAVLHETFTALRQAGMSRADARLRLAALEPFPSYPHLLASLNDDI